jgi:hypothetical protein
MRQLLYALKRQYGGPVTVYKLEDSTTNYETGIKRQLVTFTQIARAIILPVKVVREIATSITIVAANKMMVYGGSYDAGTRQFILDAQDLPTDFNLAKDDFIMYNGRRYEVKSFEEFEFHTAWSVIGKETFAEPQLPVYNHVYRPVAASALQVTQTGSA